MELIKYLVARFIRKILLIFFIFKIKENKVIFYPMNGKYYCNLKYITNKMLDNKQNNIYWCAENEMNKSTRIKFCKKMSLSFFYHFFTAKIVIFNDALPSWIVKRSGQIYLQTWHGGGAYKKINVLYKNEVNKYKKKRSKDFFENIDYVICACKAFEEAFKNDYGAKNAKYIESGMPRNDIFFDKNTIKKIAKKIKKYYKIFGEKKVILYAPTFRDNNFNNTINLNSLISIFNKDDDNVVIMLRTHPHLKKDIFNNINNINNIIDVTDYPDMQELLCAADILITDYSSCMWDFSLTYKPCFIYATDIDQYKQERDFYTPMSEWPFPIATTTDELINNILNFNQEEYIKNVKKHHKDLGSFEDGYASERICKLIETIVNKK